MKVDLLLDGGLVDIELLNVDDTKRKEPHFFFFLANGDTFAVKIERIEHMYITNEPDEPGEDDEEGEEDISQLN